MKATFPMPSPPNWHALMRAPIVHGLLLSACAHLAAIALLQPAPGSSIAPTLVINARLAPVTQAPLPAPPEDVPPEIAPVPEPPATPAPQAPVPAPPQPAVVVPPQVVAQAPAPTPMQVPMQVPMPAPGTAPPPSEAHPAPPRLETAGTASVGPEQSASPLPSLPLGVDTTWYLARQVDVQPRAMGKVEPIYPPEARRRNQEGSLKIMVKIDDLGRVQGAEVVEAHPPGVFDEAALEAFRKARFHPAMRDGRPVRMQAYIRVDFKLED